jgi:hypothetical protein
LPTTSTRCQPKRSAASGLQVLTWPSGSIVKKRPSSSQPVTSSEVGGGSAVLGPLMGAVSKALIREGAAAHASGGRAS